MEKIAKIVVSAATFLIDRPYDYKIPEKLIGHAVQGSRVLVPFGKGNKTTEGVILALAEGSGTQRLKSIDSVSDNEPLFSAADLKLALWMSDRFFCTVFDALRLMLPAVMWSGNEPGTPRAKTISYAKLLITNSEAISISEARQKRAPKQAAVLQLLAQNPYLPVKEICQITGASPSTLKSLEQSGVIALTSHEVFRRPHVEVYDNLTPITLTGAQHDVFSKILPLLDDDKPQAALLYGVTGSGKTLVYLKLIEETLSRNKTAIVLVPEISLTPQLMSIFASYFGDSVAVLHSALGVGERYDEWTRIRSGSVSVVVGTRSAVFAPLKNLGLIVIDEEQEHTYKSESSPRYHAREVAKYRVTHSNALLLLSSATPSVESMYNAGEGKYKLFRIENRFNEKALPAVFIADMKAELKNGNSGIISSVLRRELEINIQNGQQSILLINRRGANPLVTCGECGFVFHCNQCSVAMTYHTTGERLLCHYCGFSIRLMGQCPDCGGKLRFVGAGTQSVETQLHELFPGISLIRMDADTVSRVNSHANLLSRFRDEKASILLGTQMVAKGLNFENVTLVGVLSADSSLYLCDYRAHERTFALITQVIGRSGRGDMPGRAVIQTFTPAHEVIRLSSMQDYDGFYAREIELRRITGSPPINDIFTISFLGTDEAKILSAAYKLRTGLAGYLRQNESARFFGPAPAPVSKIKGKYRFRLLINCKNTKKTREIIAHAIREFSRSKDNKGITAFADADCYD